MGRGADACGPPGRERFSAPLQTDPGRAASLAGSAGQRCNRDEPVPVIRHRASPTNLDRDRNPIMSWNEITVLVEKAKTGDRAAYGELVARFQNSVYAMALSRVRD